MPSIVFDSYQGSLIAACMFNCLGKVVVLPSEFCQGYVRVFRKPMQIPRGCLEETESAKGLSVRRVQLRVSEDGRCQHGVSVLHR